MSLKNPGELFEGKSPSINVNDINHIKEEFSRVEEIRKQLNDVSSSLDNSLTEAVDKNLNFLSNEYSNQLDKFNSKINSFKEEINNKVDDFKKTNQILKADIAIVEQRQNRINISTIKEEVISDVQNLLSGDVANNIKRLEEKIDIVRDSYKQTLNEGLLNEPPSTNNSDPLTPLDKKLTLEELQKHYTLFLNRIQQQVATIGGGGAVNIREMDDVDLSTAQVNDKYLKYDSSSKKWVGADASGGGSGIGTDNVSTSTLNVVGVSTFNGVTKFDNVDVVFQGNAAAQNMTWDASENDLEFTDTARIKFGDSDDLEIWHGGSSHIKNSTNDLKIRSDSILLKRADDSEKYLEANVNNEVKLFFNNNEKFATTNTGINVTGDVEVSDTIFVANNIKHTGDTDTYIAFLDDHIELYAGGKGILTVQEASVDTVIVNDGSNNCDFRVEGLNDEHLIFSDGGTDRVGIGSAIPGAKLDVSGTLNVSGIATFRNGVNLLGLLHTNDNVNFTGQNYNLSWDKSDNALEFTDNAKATFGAGNDLEIYSNGTKGIVGGAVSFTSDVTVGTSQAVGVVLTSPNGTKYRLVVANDGTLSTSAV